MRVGQGRGYGKTPSLAEAAGKVDDYFQLMGVSVGDPFLFNRFANSGDFHQGGGAIPGSELKLERASLHGRIAFGELLLLRPSRHGNGWQKPIGNNRTARVYPNDHAPIG